MVRRKQYLLVEYPNANFHHQIVNDWEYFYCYFFDFSFDKQHTYIIPFPGLIYDPVSVIFWHNSPDEFLNSPMVRTLHLLIINRHEITKTTIFFENIFFHHEQFSFSDARQNRSLFFF